MILLRKIMPALLFLLAFAAAPASAELKLPDAPVGPILDTANILPPAQEAALAQQLEAYNAETGRALVVATVPSLQGETVEQYAVKLFEKWGIGGAETDMGVLLLVAPQERKVRIEVGYGLTPRLTDVMSGRIIRDAIIPRFRQDDYAGGIIAGVSGIVETLNLDPADAKAIAEAEAARQESGGSAIGGAVFWVFIIIFFVLIFSRGSGGKRYRRGSGVGDAVGHIILWEVLNAAARGGSGHDSGGWGGGGSSGGGGGFGGFGGGMSGGGGASGSW